jgi:hypothetical protein
MSRPARPWIAALCFALAVPVIAQEEAAVIDRILAVVDEDPILMSEVDQLIGLGLVERQDEEAEEEYRRRVLVRLIDQRLRFHEIDRFGFAELPIEEVERQYQAFAEGFGSAGEFADRLAELGLDETGLKQLVARQIMVVTYVEERLGPRVFVGLDDITAYYDTVLTPEMAAQGQPLPPIQEVREQIRDVLKQQRLNQEIDRWTELLRAKADIEDYAASGRDAPPEIELSDG